MGDAPLNPYQSPLEASYPPEVNPRPARLKTAIGQSSGLGSRFLAAVLDANVTTVLFLAVAMSLADDERPYQWIPLMAAFSSYFGYFYFSEWLLGGTPAKLFFGLRVRQLSGERCTARQIAIRNLIRILEINPVLGGLPAGIAILSTKRRQRLGDLFAGTVVERK